MPDALDPSGDDPSGDDPSGDDLAGDVPDGDDPAGEIPAVGELAGTRDGDDVPPMLPSRTAFLLSFGAVVLAGIFGAIIGYGVADVGSSSDAAKFLGTLLGSVIGAGGVGVVAVLVLRAMAEWNRQTPADRARKTPRRS